MDPFGGVQSFWDLSSQPNTFSALPDDDFLAFLEKQFPTSVGNNGLTTFDSANAPEVIDPQSLSRYPLPSTSPPSSDSSPSPPSINTEHSPSRRQSGTFNTPASSVPTDQDEQGLKRKASDDSISGEPTHKSQHTSNSSNKKSSASRRKSTGNPSQDETRLLKRKEQNRAAQRAFRERKEKHVKDLEDKVAALEAKNQMSESENENLRDLLSRLQNENMMLKQAAFTFSVPRDNTPNMTNGNPASGSVPQSFNFTSPGAGPSRAPQSAPALNFNSLISFDPNAMNDEPTATDSAMNMDFGFGQPHCSYKTIAANPMYMSFAEPSPHDSSPSSNGGQNGNGNGSFANSFSSPFDQWSPPGGDTNGLDQLFGGNYLGTTSGVDFNALLKSPPSSISPVSHFRSPSSSSPSSSSAASPGSNGQKGEPCPKTKEDMAKHIVDQGNSAFAQCEVPIAPFLRKSVGDETGGPMIMCKGSSFPPTEKSDKNVEVLTAWRSITSNPQFKDLDINELCSEFTNKARCDGTKVVLEPQGVHHIIETLAAKRQAKQ